MWLLVVYFAQLPFIPPVCTHIVLREVTCSIQQGVGTPLGFKERLIGGRALKELIKLNQLYTLHCAGALTAGLNWYRANLNLAALASTKPALPPIKLDMPVLGLWSSDEAYLTEDGMIASQHVVAEGRWVYKRVEGAGHWMMRDAPGTVNELLAEFVADKVQH
jgi:pimeloyl-ACP methyl ester carboxylesterase